jgi:hypothetical protein
VRRQEVDTKDARKQGENKGGETMGRADKEKGKGERLLTVGRGKGKGMKVVERPGEQREKRKEWNERMVGRSKRMRERTRNGAASTETK